jgi:tetratricopeptide (TPR) repeat protein
MRKYLPHIFIISFVFLLVPTAHVATYAGEIEDAKEEVRKYPDEAWAHNNLGLAYLSLHDRDSAIDQYKILKKLDTKRANELFDLIYE